MILGGSLPYLPQYLQMREEKTSEGFSMKLCLVLLIANILRIAFWFGKFYETPLLIQSIVMIVTMLIMLEICIRLRKDLPISVDNTCHFLDLDPQSFWTWNSFSDYLQCILSIVLLVAGATYLGLANDAYVETIGTLSLCIEATLAMPQLCKNFRSGSTRGMNAKMVIMWFLGDSFKTLYFVLRGSPVQFLMCGSVQILVDMLILYQVMSYDTDRAD